MGKFQYKLAPLRWYLGQTLLPEHFNTQQVAIADEIRLRAAIAGLPGFGVARLSWNEASLRSGTLSISELTVVLPDGRIVDVPGNATLDSFSLAQTGSSRATVYLHLLKETTSPSGNEVYAKDPPVVQRVMYRLQLSVAQVLPNSDMPFRLAEFKSESGKWSLSSDVLPPLLQVGENPFLSETIEGLVRALLGFRPQLEQELTESLYRTDRIAAVRRCLNEVCRTLSHLEDLKFGVHRHPFFLFDALRNLYFEVCSFHESLPAESVVAYRHEQLAECLGVLLREKHSPVEDYPKSFPKAMQRLAGQGRRVGERRARRSGGEERRCVLGTSGTGHWTFLGLARRRKA
ncbi:MAG: type VI secretion system baseplate subunit TssK [Polyangia bacterium]